MALEKLRRWISREHRTVRKEVVNAFRQHGIEIKGRDLLGYKKEELLQLKDALSELKEKHDLTVRELINNATKYGFAPFGWDPESLVRNRLKKKVFLGLLKEYIKGIAKEEASRITGLAPEVAEIKEIEYDGRKIRLTPTEVARFLSEHGLRHADRLQELVSEKIVQMRSAQLKESEKKEVSLEDIKNVVQANQRAYVNAVRALEEKVQRIAQASSEPERKKEEALAIINMAREAGVKGVRVGDQRIPLEDIERAVKAGQVYAYLDAVRALERAIQKSTRSKKKVKPEQIVEGMGKFIAIWMPRGREPAPLIKKDLVHVLENAKEIAAKLEKAYRDISAYDVSHVGHANAAEAVYTALRENPQDVIRGMIEELNEILHANAGARVRTYEIHGPESVFPTINRAIGEILRREIESLSQNAAKQPEEAAKVMTEERAYALGRQLASVLWKMHKQGSINLKSVPG